MCSPVPQWKITKSENPDEIEIEAEKTMFFLVEYAFCESLELMREQFAESAKCFQNQRTLYPEIKECMNKLKEKGVIFSYSSKFYPLFEKLGKEFDICKANAGTNLDNMEECILDMKNNGMYQIQEIIQNKTKLI